MIEQRYSDGKLAKWYYSQENVICDGTNEYYLASKESIRNVDYSVLLGTNDLLDELNQLSDENEQLKKQIHLMHMKTMFSTVQSFKGDVSKRYKYSKERDTVYDTANRYGQYYKILDKKEIVMLLNEYETVLNELKGDVE